uniref:Odorant receptor n=1 Tax=Ctenopseustis obliquana TaxID=65030 RepID=A0A097IYN1_9NEOP|nr:olfactory receptor 68 [Ctenopseustis obliquana]
MPPTLVGTLSQHLKIFKIIGLDFLGDPSVVNHCRHVWFVSMLLLFFIGQLLFFAKSDEIEADFMDIANAIPLFMMAIQDLVKIVALSKKQRVKGIILEIAELWPKEMINEEKRCLMNSWIRNLKMFNDYVYKFTTFSVFIFVWGTFFVTVFTTSDGVKTYLFPFQLYYPFNIDSMWKYSAAFFFQAVTGTTIHLCLYLPCDLLLFTLTVDICILMRLLQYDLENIKVVEKDRNGVFDPAEAEKSYRAVTELARTHQKLVKISENLNEVFGTIIFTVVSLSAVILCFFGFLLITVGGTQFQMVRSFLAVFVKMFIVFCLALPGQILSDASCGVADAAYKSLWYESDLKFRKIIFIMIARSQKPCFLSALGYSQMNFNTFCKICSSSWSYLSLLNQMYQDTER